MELCFVMRALCVKAVGMILDVKLIHITTGKQRSGNMTKEQAIEILKQRECCRECVVDNGDCNDCDKAFEMAIEALETVEEFEKAQIITGGRLNGRTYAYKCGLEDGKRKALEQQPSDDCVSRQAVLDKAELIELEDGQTFYCISPEDVKALLSVTPTHGTCKDCKYNRKNPYARKHYTCELGNRCKLRDCDNFFCADFEKRGSEDGSN